MPAPTFAKTISTQEEAKEISDFDAIRLKIASPEVILSWSSGEVTKPETINYRTQKPERDGLFCEKIFGPVKDWECACGKYKKIRYRGIVCDRCGVEVTRSIVRRERMGHINLAAPVSHIWFLKGSPCKIGLILDLSTPDLESVIYFTKFIITKVNEDLKAEALKQAEREYKSKRNEIKAEKEKEKSRLIQNFNKQESKKLPNSSVAQKKELASLEIIYQKKLDELKRIFTQVKKELADIKVGSIIPEVVYYNLSLKYGHIFEAKLGAEAIRELLSKVDLEALAKELEKKAEEAPPTTYRKIIRRLKLIKSLIKNKMRPEWMILTVLPVIPPELRPMVQIDGGRFASSDLNDLYRRVINRNNRLKRLIELAAPEVICRNEKRMLQEAVDALIDNEARRGKVLTVSTGQKRALKSLAGSLKGKQGRFRQNLLGKRVDYSGRSVIVVGPHLKLHQCGLPKTMAIELFKPFVISQLIKKGYAHNVRRAGQIIEAGSREVWDILEEITKKSYVLLNRAPTLHRLGIQAFQPILIEGKAIQIHPLVCAAFNADFDGDQMAVHVPLAQEAQEEAQEIMASHKNLLKPATGDPIVIPAKDMIWSVFYMTQIVSEASKKPLKVFSSPEEAVLAYQMDKVGLREPVKVKIENELIETNLGRIIFNSFLPKEIRRYNQVIDKKILKEIIIQLLEYYGEEETVVLLDKIKEVTFEYLTKSGLSWGMDDLPFLKRKAEIIQEAEKKIEEIDNQYQTGFLAEDERSSKAIEVWFGVVDRITELSKEALRESSSVYSIISSGARGSIGQITQMMGVKGLVTNPAGEIIELPIKSNYKEGLDVLEYFISTHGARKGLSDTALKTANAGYLTRRLIDVAQDVSITEKECKDQKGILITKKECEEEGVSLKERIWGRTTLENVYCPKTKKIIIKAGEVITKEKADLIEKTGKEEIRIRSVITCRTRRGICQACYGYDLAYNRLVDLNTSVGIIAAQSIGEPGTQLTLRTFHVGGVVGLDITQGLPRVEELFEARPVRGKAHLAEEDGRVEIDEKSKKIKIKYKALKEEKYILDKKEGIDLKVKDGQKVKTGDVLFEKEGKEIKAHSDGQIKIEENLLKIIHYVLEEKEYLLNPGQTFLVKHGDLVKKGDQLTDGNLDLYELYRLKGKEAVQRYILKEVRFIYSSHGQKVDDKHVEIIVRQMFSRVYIKDPGDTDFSIGEIVSKSYFEETNEEIVKKKGKPAQGRELLLGITKASLATDSFLSAASFQETARVLIEAATSGRVDRLYGLKENVIIGRLIPVGTGARKL